MFLHDHLVGPIAPYAKLRIPAKILNAEKVWKLWEMSTVPTLTMDQYATLLRVPNTILPGKGIISWNLQDVPLGGVSYFIHLRDGKLLSLH